MANSDSSVAEECWEILNSSYQSTICIQYPTHLISFASVYLAYQLTFLEIPPAIRSFELLTKCSSKIGEIIGDQPTKVDVVIDIIDLLKSLSSSPEELKNYDRITQNLLELKIEQANEGNQELIKVHKLPEKRRIEEQKIEGERRSRHDRNDKRPFERHDRATYDRPVERPHAGYDRYERNGDWERREFRREEYPQRGTAREEFREIPHRREEYPEPVNSYPPRYREYQHPPRDIQRPVDPREFRDRHREPPRDYPREYRGKRPQEYRQYDREYRR
ncbi:hypothetical protein HK103_003880 [Boothiomyces macroporosus]|uniref:Uncharacterized protein n=1 Tax=Boothiomyces macroporosus TaxID=261099 RepID=A0AAD5UM86_9FUNG|nr:hypothetical protein HK103_003880 [Boothiomyces macroporosus]